MTKGAIFIRKQGDDEPRDATSPLEGYEYIGVVDGDVVPAWYAAGRLEAVARSIREILGVES